jgi:hypothetical protein
LLTASNTSLYAGECRKNVISPNPELNKAQVVRQDMISGIWSYTDKVGYINSIQFFDYGIAETLVTDLEGTTCYNDMIWRIEEKNGEVSVVLTAHDMKHEHIFRVNQNCDGIVLTDVSSDEVTYINYTPKADAAFIQNLESNLYGDWSNITAPFDEIGIQESGSPTQFDNTFLRFSFEADNTFTCAYGNNAIQIEETGFWRLWDNGKYLILFVKENPKSDKFIDVRVAKVRHVDSHSLYLEHEMLARDLMRFTNKPSKGMGFIK